MRTVVQSRVLRYVMHYSVHWFNSDSRRCRCLPLTDEVDPHLRLTQVRHQTPPRTPSVSAPASPPLLSSLCMHISLSVSASVSFRFHECMGRLAISRSRLRLWLMPFLWFAHLYDEVGHGPVDHTLLHLRQLPKWVNPLHTITAQRHACSEKWRLRWVLTVHRSTRWMV
jgi:hypothetical protein